MYEFEEKNNINPKSQYNQFNFICRFIHFFA